MTRKSPVVFSRQAGSADANLLMTGFLCLLAGAALVAALAGLGIWSYVTGPEPTLTQRLAKEQAEQERLQERYLLLSQLPTDTQELTCVPVPTKQVLDCKLVREGLLTLKISHFDATIPKELPLVGIRFLPGTRDLYALDYDKPISREQRLAVIRSLTPPPH